MLFVEKKSWTETIFIMSMRWAVITSQYSSIDSLCQSCRNLSAYFFGINQQAGMWLISAWMFVTCASLKKLFLDRTFEAVLFTKRFNASWSHECVRMSQAGVIFESRTHLKSWWNYLKLSYYIVTCDMFYLKHMQKVWTLLRIICVGSSLYTHHSRTLVMALVFGMGIIKIVDF